LVRASKVESDSHTFSYEIDIENSRFKKGTLIEKGCFFGTFFEDQVFESYHTCHFTRYIIWKKTTAILKRNANRERLFFWHIFKKPQFWEF